MNQGGVGGPKYPARSGYSGSRNDRQRFGGNTFQRPETGSTGLPLTGTTLDPPAMVEINTLLQSVAPYVSPSQVSKVLRFVTASSAVEVLNGLVNAFTAPPSFSESIGGKLQEINELAGHIPGVGELISIIMSEAERADSMETEFLELASRYRMLFQQQNC